MVVMKVLVEPAQPQYPAHFNRSQEPLRSSHRRCGRTDARFQVNTFKMEYTSVPFAAHSDNLQRTCRHISGRLLRAHATPLASTFGASSRAVFLAFPCIEH